jgi:O-antigen/teichoic acid export membrane protein
MLRRFLKAANATLFGQVIARFGSFLLLPIFLSRWTPAVYGEWLTLYAAVGYLASLDVGMQAAALNRLTAAYARHDLSDYRRAQNSAFAMYTVTAGLGLVLLTAATATMPIGRWLGLRYTSEKDAAVVLLFLGAYVLLSMPGKVVIGSYQTMGNLAKSQWVSNIRLIATFGATGALLLLNQGMRSLASVPLFTTVATVIFVLLSLRREHPEIAPGIGAADWHTIRGLMKPSVMFALVMGAMLLHYQALTMVVSVALGGAAVTVYVVSRTMTSMLRAATDTIADSVTPDICRLDALQDRTQLRQILRFLAGLSVCIGVAGSAAIWWEGASVISVWTRGRLVPDVQLLRLLSLVAIGQSAWVGLGVFGAATNRNRTVATCYVASNVIAVALAIALIHTLGTRAIPIGLLVGEALACYHFIVWDACKHCSERYLTFALKLWLFVAGATALALSGTYFVHRSFPAGTTLFRWLAVAIVSSVLSGVTTWFAWFGTDERGKLKSRLVSLFRAEASEASELAVDRGITPLVVAERYPED